MEAASSRETAIITILNYEEAPYMYRSDKDDTGERRIFAQKKDKTRHLGARRHRVPRPPRPARSGPMADDPGGTLPGRKKRNKKLFPWDGLF